MPGPLLARGLADPGERGLAGERLAARWLRRRGCRLLARRLVTRFGELDLVVLEGDVLVAVEVKTGRRGPRWSPGMRVGPRQLARLQRAVRDVARHFGAARYRIDLVEICLDAGTGGKALRPVPCLHRDLRRPLPGPSRPD